MLKNLRVLIWHNEKGEAPLTGSGVAMLWSLSNCRSCLNCSAGQRLPPLPGWPYRVSDQSAHDSTSQPLEVFLSVSTAVTTSRPSRLTQ